MKRTELEKKAKKTVPVAPLPESPKYIPEEEEEEEEAKLPPAPTPAKKKKAAAAAPAPEEEEEEEEAKLPPAALAPVPKERPKQIISAVDTIYANYQIDVLGKDKANFQQYKEEYHKKLSAAEQKPFIKIYEEKKDAVMSAIKRWEVAHPKEFKKYEEEKEKTKQNRLKKKEGSAPSSAPAPAPAAAVPKSPVLATAAEVKPHAKDRITAEASDVIEAIDTVAAYLKKYIRVPPVPAVVATPTQAAPAPAASKKREAAPAPPAAPEKKRRKKETPPPTSDEEEEEEEETSSDEEATEAPKIVIKPKKF